MAPQRINKSIVPFVFVPLFLLLVVFPLLALVFNLDVEGMTATLTDQVFWIAVRNTLWTAFLASLLGLIVAIGFGYYHLYSQQSPIYKVANLLNDLPIALPHTVAGLALLLAFGRNNFGFLGNTGLAFTLFAVVLGMFFVSYSLCARTIASGVDQTEREVVDVARTLGDTPTQAYFKIVLPSIGEAVFSGFVLAFSRSLSEFAAVIMFGGNLPGRTQVLASYVFTKVEEGELEMAVTAAVFCILLSVMLVAALSWGRSHYAHSRVVA
ncbi:ABC transporter permease [Anaerosoma tenue]|uniref:ABC transporter permease n=1 Tax=Anaerosoma tenue TaxID=2933588 RepID=UPI00226096EC|nr:ABC transporter permease [Anaerosoma tenue]MCK8115563.1 ABC transporter permease [Anaerosoma tenue]